MPGFAHTFLGSSLIIVSCIAVALTILALLHRLWPPSARMHNDVVGPSVGVIGTTYAVIVAFMLSGVWSDFQTAQVNAEQEANCLVNIFRFSDRLPKETATTVQKLAHDYAVNMVEVEWPAMANESSTTSQALMAQIWRALIDTQNQDAAQQLILDHSFAELSSMTEHRRIRLLQSHERLPPILWAVLVLGGIVTVTATCLFGVQNFRLHIAQVFAITLLIALMLVAIDDIDRPFQGNVRVSSDGFRYALQSFQDWRTSQK